VELWQPRHHSQPHLRPSADSAATGDGDWLRFAPVVSATQKHGRLWGIAPAQRPCRLPTTTTQRVAMAAGRGTVPEGRREKEKGEEAVEAAPRTVTPGWARTEQHWPVTGDR